MKKILTLAALAALALSVQAQSTNLTANMAVVFNNLSPAVQQSTLQCLLDYNKACRKSPEWAGVTTNISYTFTYATNGADVTVVGTNTVTTVTTNHVQMSLTEWLQTALASEKVSRVVEQRNQAMRDDIIRAVGTGIVNGWGN